MGTEIENKTKKVDIERVKQLLKKYRNKKKSNVKPTDELTVSIGFDGYEED
jgi:hypothetical protein